MGVCPSATAPSQFLFNGAAWTPFSGALPPARSAAAMAYDRDRDRVLLFGGEALPSGALLGDTWEFEWNVWTQR